MPERDDGPDRVRTPGPRRSVGAGSAGGNRPSRRPEPSPVELSSADRRRLLRFGLGAAAIGGLAVAATRVLSPRHSVEAAASATPLVGSPAEVRAAVAAPRLEPPIPDLATGPTTVAGVRGDVVDRVGAHAVAFTFDDGPDEEFTPKVLAFLADHHLHATFSLIGRQVERYPALARSVVAAGMTVCNHTWDHDEGLGTRPRRDVETDIGRAQTIITAATGVQPVFFRAPGGAWSRTVLAVCADAAMIPLGWDVDSRDWSRPGTAGIVANVTSEVRPGSVMLFHDGGGDRAETLEALPRILRLLAAKGYGVTQLLPRPTTLGDAAPR